MNENFSYDAEARDSLLSREEEPLTFTDLLFEVAEFLDIVLIPQPRPSLEMKKE